MMKVIVRWMAYALFPVILSGCTKDPPKYDSPAPDSNRTTPMEHAHDDESHVDDETEAEIVRMAGQLAETTFDAKLLCDKIARLPDEKERKRYFNLFMDTAYAVRFEDIGDVHASGWDERMEVHRRLGYAYAGLENLSLAIWSHLWAQGASQREQFTPLFRYAEKMKEEAIRLGKRYEDLPLGLDVIERIYGVNVKAGGSPSDFTWVEEEFKRISGRQIRTEKQVDDDNRTEALRKMDNRSRNGD